MPTTSPSKPQPCGVGSEFLPSSTTKVYRRKNREGRGERHKQAPHQNQRVIESYHSVQGEPPVFQLPHVGKFKHPIPTVVMIHICTRVVVETLRTESRVPCDSSRAQAYGRRYYRLLCGRRNGSGESMRFNNSRAAVAHDSSHDQRSIPKSISTAYLPLRRCPPLPGPRSPAAFSGAYENSRTTPASVRMVRSPTIAPSLFFSSLTRSPSVFDRILSHVLTKEMAQREGTRKSPLDPHKSPTEQLRWTTDHAPIPPPFRPRPHEHLRTPEFSLREMCPSSPLHANAI